MSKKKTLILVAVALAATLAIIVNQTPSRKGATENNVVSISLGYRPGVAVDLALINGIQNGELLKAGFDIQLKPYGRADLIFNAINAGEIQGSLGIPFEPVLEQASKGNYPVRSFLVWYFDATRPYDGFITLASSSVSSLDQIGKGPVGSHPSKQVTSFVKSMVPGTEVKPYNPIAPFTALDSREVVAIYALEPFLSLARANPKYRVLEVSSISKRVFGGQRVPAAVSVLSASWVDKHPEEARKFVAAVQANFTSAQNGNTQGLAEVLKKPEFGGLSADVVKTVVEPAGSITSDLPKTGLDSFLDYLVRNSLIQDTKQINIEQIIGSF